MWKRSLCKNLVSRTLICHIWYNFIIRGITQNGTSESLSILSCVITAQHAPLDESTQTTLHLITPLKCMPVINCFEDENSDLISRTLQWAMDRSLVRTRVSGSLILPSFKGPEIGVSLVCNTNTPTYTIHRLGIALAIDQHLKHHPLSFTLFFGDSMSIYYFIGIWIPRYLDEHPSQTTRIWALLPSTVLQLSLQVVIGITRVLGRCIKMCHFLYALAH